MIAKQHRFHGRGSLNYVYRKGRTVRSEYLSLRYAKSRREDYRLAVVVSRKVSKSAVKRNRIRRVIYEIARLYRQDLGQPWPFDLVISVYDERVIEGSHSKVSAAVRALLQKAAL